MKIKSINTCKNIVGKKVLLRIDFNVPIKNAKVADDYKIIRALDTIKFLMKNNCKIIIVTHLGRPVPGQREKEYSVKPVASKLSQMLSKKIEVVDDFKTLAGGTKIGKMQQGEIVMLENIRYEEGEKENNKDFAKKLSKIAELYVNDAFAVCHRSDASVSAIKNFLPSFAGLLLEQELVNLNKVISPINPLVVLLGGSKISTKISLISNFQNKAEKILIGGAMANNFFVADGFEVGKSLIDDASIAYAKKTDRKNLFLPVDVIVSTDQTGGNIKIKKINQISKDDYIFDIGPETIKLYAKYLKIAKTIIWNGPMGFFEISAFKSGTVSLAQEIAVRSKGSAFGAVGGGETVEALRMIGMEQYIDWVSTGGGAMLSYLGGENMPGLNGIMN